MEVRNNLMGCLPKHCHSFFSWVQGERTVSGLFSSELEESEMSPNNIDDEKQQSSFSWVYWANVMLSSVMCKQTSCEASWECNSTLPTTVHQNPILAKCFWETYVFLPQRCRCRVTAATLLMQGCNCCVSSSVSCFHVAQTCWLCSLS